MSRSEHEAREILSAAEQLEREANTHAEDKQRMTSEWERERASLVRENRRLKAERAASAPAGGPGTFGPPRSSEGSPALGRRSGKGHTTYASRHRQPSPSPAKGKEDGTPGSRSSPHGAAPRASEVVRSLSLKQLVDYIEAIYASKVKFDAKCNEARLPRETVEQHMYTFLNQRYGLKSLIVEHATAIHKAVAKYEGQSNDVAVFGKILRNEIDEEFHQVQRQVKDTAKELLRVYLKGKFPLKTDDALGKMHEERMRGDVHEEEWTDIVQYMYNAEDAARVMDRLRAQVRQPPPPPRRARGQPRGKASPVEQRARHEYERGPVPWRAVVKVRRAPCSRRRGTDHGGSPYLFIPQLVPDSAGLPAGEPRPLSVQVPLPVPQIRRRRQRRGQRGPVPQPGGGRGPVQDREGVFRASGERGQVQQRAHHLLRLRGCPLQRDRGHELPGGRLRGRGRRRRVRVRRGRKEGTQPIVPHCLVPQQ